jgi:hypothetical protein
MAGRETKERERVREKANGKKRKGIPFNANIYLAACKSQVI